MKLFERLNLKYKYLFTDKEIDIYSKQVDRLSDIGRDYLSNRVYTCVRPYMDNFTWHPIVHNKWISINFLRSLSIPVPQTLGFLHRDYGTTLKGVELRNSKDLEKVVKDHNLSEIVIKHIGGGVGNSVFIVQKIEYDQAGFRYTLNNGEVIDGPFIDSILTNQTGGLNGYLVEEKLTYSPEINEISNSSFASIRIHTLKLKTGKIGIDNVYLRLGVNGALTDHKSNGGIMCVIDENDGSVKRAFRGDDVIERHPDSNMVLENFKIPNWPQIVDTVKRAANRCPEIKYIGWDIVPTIDGPVILEGNVGENLPLVQTLFGGYLKNGTFNSWADHLGFDPNFKKLSWKIKHWYGGRRLSPIERFIADVFYN